MFNRTGKTGQETLELLLQASAEHEFLKTHQLSLTQHMEDPYWTQRRAELPTHWERAGVSVQLMQEGMNLERAMQVLEDQMRVRHIPSRSYGTNQVLIMCATKC